MGRPQFAAAGTSGGGQKVAVNSRPEVKGIDSSQTGSVASGSTETIDIYAPTGSVYSVLGSTMTVAADGTATSGTHYLQVKSVGAEILRGESNYNTKLQFKSGQWASADVASGTYPEDAAASAEVLRAVRATENTPIRIKYYNQTDAAQDNSRDLFITVEEDSY